MKALNLKRNCCALAIIALLCANSLNLQAGWPSTPDTLQVEKKNYLATSVFVLSSLIPDDDTYFFQLDYGRKLSRNLDAVISVNSYKYKAPMSTPILDTTRYKGTVTSYGVVFSMQYYFWKNFFINQMVNPLILEYTASENKLKTKGFMLLLATRVGYHYDINLMGKPFFIEVAAEACYWPVNSNVPAEFKAIDDLYNSLSFNPAIQFGFRF